MAGDNKESHGLEGAGLAVYKLRPELGRWFGPGKLLREHLGRVAAHE